MPGGRPPKKKKGQAARDARWPTRAAGDETAVAAEDEVTAHEADIYVSVLEEHDTFGITNDHIFTENDV